MTRRRRRWQGRGSDIHSVSKVRTTFISPSKYASIDVLFSSWQAKSFCGCVWFWFFLCRTPARSSYTAMNTQICKTKRDRLSHGYWQKQRSITKQYLAVCREIGSSSMPRISMPLRYLYKYRHRFIWQVSQPEGKVPVCVLVYVCVCVCVYICVCVC